MASHSRTRCDFCREKGVVILPDDSLVCYGHYNKAVAEAVTMNRKVEARLKRG